MYSEGTSSCCGAKVFLGMCSECHEHCECEDIELLNFTAELSACGDAYENGRDIA
jgi:hypothetical protein